MKIRYVVPSIIFCVLIICNISKWVSLISAIAIVLIDILWYLIETLSDKDGIIHIIETQDKITWNFELASDPEQIRKKKTVTFGVKDSSS